MTKDEALRLALEALGWTDEWRPQGLKEEAITAIKAALEAKDEPVAIADGGVLNWIADKQFMHEAELYTTPPQRTWVGLTDEDNIDWEEGGNLKDLVKAIEAKLKEKNT
jgi:hypothetical protein